MPSKQVTIADLKGFIERNYLLNRTIVTSDIPKIFDDIEMTIGLDVVRHRFATGEEHGTWIVPKRWDIKTGWLKGPDGKIIASYDEHPLFVSPYSCPIHTHLSKSEVLEHTVTEPKQPEAFAFNWRYASDARLQLKDWGISLPEERARSLVEGQYELLIEADIEDGEMLVGEVVIDGQSTESILFIANYCHPGQVNDSFSGLVLFMKVMSDLAKKDRLKYTYRFLFCQETIGSAIYIASNPHNLDGVIGAMFSEMVGWGEDWYLKQTRSGGTLMDALARECARTFSYLNLSEFFTLIGNDEYILNSVQVGVPTLSLQKYPFDEYHTSNDNPDHIKDEDLQTAIDITEHMINVLERNSVYRFVHNVPFWMTRFDLYSDDVYEPEDFVKRLHIVYEHVDGKNSILEIAEKMNVPFAYVYDYVIKMANYDLVELVQLES